MIDFDWIEIIANSTNVCQCCLSISATFISSIYSIEWISGIRRSVQCTKGNSSTISNGYQWTWTNDRKFSKTTIDRDGCSGDSQSNIDQRSMKGNSLFNDGHVFDF